MSHSHVIEILNTDPEIVSFEKVVVNTFSITCVSIKGDTVTIKTTTDVFNLKRKNAQVAAVLYEDFRDKIILVHKFEQDARKSDAYNNFE